MDTSSSPAVPLPIQLSATFEFSQKAVKQSQQPANVPRKAAAEGPVPWGPQPRWEEARWLQVGPTPAVQPSGE